MGSSGSSSLRGSILQKDGSSSNSRDLAIACKTYMKIFLGGTAAVMLVIFAVFSIYWGSLWKTPVRNLPGWVVDFDGNLLGESVTQALLQHSSGSKVTWTSIPASRFPRGTDEVAELVLDEQTWISVTINPGSTAKLLASITTPNASYSGVEAITVYGVEARSENAYRNLIRPSVQASLDAISRQMAIQVARQVANASNLALLLDISPQTVVAPISYQIQNLAPFDIPVATAVTFVGLILQLILSFLIVNISLRAREESGLGRSLSTRSLILLRLGSSFGAYLVISLFYSIFNLAFKIHLDRVFGRAGFIIFWMLNYCGMLSVGLALESLITLLTPKGVPFFMLTFIIVNISVCSFPIEVLPSIFRYGYAAPFYNTSKAARTILFGTKNQLPTCFGVLIVWIAISCMTLPLIQWFVRRRDARAAIQLSTTSISTSQKA